MDTETNCFLFPVFFFWGVVFLYVGPDQARPQSLNNAVLSRWSNVVQV